MVISDLAHDAVSVRPHKSLRMTDHVNVLTNLWQFDLEHGESRETVGGLIDPEKRQISLWILRDNTQAE